MTTSVKDAKALLAVRLGDEQLVPANAQGQGAAAVVAAALKRLADIKKERAPVLYRSAPARACSGSAYDTEAET